ALPPGEIVEAADAGGLQRRLPGRPDAPDHPDRLARQESRRIAPPDYREAARLVEVGGDLGEELVVRQADRAREPQLSLHPIEEPREKYRRRRPVQTLGAGEVEERLVERQGFDDGGEFIHHRPDLPRDSRVMRPPR